MTVNSGNPNPDGSFQLSPELLEALQPLSEPIAKLRNQTLVHQGTECRGVYIVHQGFTRLSILADDGREIFRRLLGPGCIIGLPATLCSTPYSFSANCESDCVFHFVPAPVFREFMRTQPVLGIEVVRLMGQELSEMNQHRTNFQNCRPCGCPLADTCEHELGNSSR